MICKDLRANVLYMRPSTAPAARPPAALPRPNQHQQQHKSRTSDPTLRAHVRRTASTPAVPKADAFEQEVSGTISRLRLVTGWNWGEFPCILLSSQRASMHASEHDARLLIRIPGVRAGIEMRAYSIATTALRRLVVDAAGQMQVAAAPAQPEATLAELQQGDETMMEDLNMLLKHVQRSCSV